MENESRELLKIRCVGNDGKWSCATTSISRCSMNICPSANLRHAMVQVSHRHVARRRARGRNRWHLAIVNFSTLWSDWEPETIVWGFGSLSKDIQPRISTLHIDQWPMNSFAFRISSRRCFGMPLALPMQLPSWQLVLEAQGPKLLALEMAESYGCCWEIMRISMDVYGYLWCFLIFMSMLYICLHVATSNGYLMIWWLQRIPMNAWLKWGN